MSINKLKQLIEFLTTAAGEAQTVRTREEGFAVHHLRRTSDLRFSEIVSVTALKVGKVTYDENYLIFLGKDGCEVAVGELAEGIAELEHALFQAWPEFPRRWSALVEHAPVGQPICIWNHGSTAAPKNG